MMAYSIGDPADPLSDDPRFDTREAAEIAAIERTVTELHSNEVLAVWEDGSGEILALVFCGIVYQP